MVTVRGLSSSLEQSLSIASRSISSQLEKLRAKYGPEAKIAVVDESADRCGDAFFICVVSSAFDGVGLLDRQRSINETLATEIAGVHAVQVKAWTPS